MANHHGDFIWYELMTSDAPAAEQFYAPLLNWTISGDPAYRHIEATEGGIGGILALSDDMMAGGARPGWIGYVLVDDVDQMVASIEGSGGRTLWPARDMENVGRMAMVTDPQGAAFYIMKPQPPADRPDMEIHAFSYDRPRLGHCAWNELATSDPAAALQFYGQRFGWVKDGEMDMGPLGKYEFLRHAGRAPDGSPMGQGMLGAVWAKPPEMPVSAWTFYFRVADIDAAVAYIKGNGGSVMQEPMEIPGGDFSLNAIDPQGAYFALVGSRGA
ncbi:MAG: VOC family protein [Erythrobacter sp.]|nr:MAG: VOC family protein [Erythrobacter sp.]